MKENYLSFLLRIWKSGVPENPDWRLSIENSLTRERVAFDSLEGLVEYLKVKVSEDPTNERPQFDGSNAGQTE